MQLGVVRALDFSDLLDIPAALATGRRASGRRVGILTSTGGAGTLVADSCGLAELDVALPDAATAHRLATLLDGDQASASPQPGRRHPRRIAARAVPLRTLRTARQPRLRRGGGRRRVLRHRPADPGGRRRRRMPSPQRQAHRGLRQPPRPRGRPPAQRQGHRRADDAGELRHRPGRARPAQSATDRCETRFAGSSNRTAGPARVALRPAERGREPSRLRTVRRAERARDRRGRPGTGPGRGGGSWAAPSS